jgi:hypothetical protein
VRSFLIVISAVSAILLNVTPFASAATLPPNAKQMAALHYLIGTWHCTWPSNGKVGSEEQIFEEALGGAWLQEKEVVTGADGRPATMSIHYTGYDPAKGRYMHVGPDADGSYELASSADMNAWEDASDATSTFVHTKVSDTQRTMKLSYQDAGKPMSLLMACTKQP